MNAATCEVQSYTTRPLDADRPLFLLRACPQARSAANPVLLLHGSSLPGSLAYALMFDGKSWLSDLSAHGRDGWALDFRGYGRSWKPADDGVRPCVPVADTAQAVEDVGEAIAFILRETGAESVDLVGWSWGATVAACYAARHTGIGRLVLHAPQWLRDTPSPMVTSQSMSEPYRTIDAAAFIERWLGRADPVARDVLARWRKTLERSLVTESPINVPNGSARDIATQWMAGRPAYDPADIVVPTLVIVGANDTDTPPALARTVFERLGAPEKSFVEIPDGTHFTVFEPAREALFRHTAAFLAANQI
jgi:pimeloyl-ACP methyl ester carboxylesterase